MTYHLALEPKDWSTKGTGTLILQARHCIDYLSCEIWLYLGERHVTKTHLRAHKAEILAQVNRQYNTTYKRLTVD